jgi:excinuclease ABC subunit C
VKIVLLVAHHPESHAQLHPELVSGSSKLKIVQSDVANNWIPDQVRNDKTATFREIPLENNSHIAKLIARLDDEAHRFAISYHENLKRVRQTKNALEDIAGIGPATRKKLIKAFGSVAKIREADETDIARVIDKKLAARVKQNL